MQNALARHDWPRLMSRGPQATDGAIACVVHVPWKEYVHIFLHSGRCSGTVGYTASSMHKPDRPLLP
nr:hypothetical protein CFP56_00289 [Quercus suber]